MFCPDNYSQWESREREQEKWLLKRPVCSRCWKHIQDERAWRINDELVCDECAESEFRVWTEDYIE